MARAVSSAASIASRWARFATSVSRCFASAALGVPDLEHAGDLIQREPELAVEQDLLQAQHVRFTVEQVSRIAPIQGCTNPIRS